MNPRSRLILFLSLAMAIAAVGIPYWLIPYSRLSLPSSLLTPGLAVPAALACWCRYNGQSWSSTLLVTASVPPAVVLLRVVADATRDPTSHNLWPLEVVIASVIGVIVAVVGLVVGWVLLKTLRPERPDDT
jgi:hypothetical protein